MPRIMGAAVAGAAVGVGAAAGSGSLVKKPLEKPNSKFLDSPFSPPIRKLQGGPEPDRETPDTPPGGGEGGGRGPEPDRETPDTPPGGGEGGGRGPEPDRETPDTPPGGGGGEGGGRGPDPDRETPDTPPGGGEGGGRGPDPDSTTSTTQTPTGEGGGGGPDPDRSGSNASSSNATTTLRGEGKGADSASTTQATPTTPDPGASPESVCLGIGVAGLALWGIGKTATMCNNRDIKRSQEGTRAVSSPGDSQGDSDCRPAKCIQKADGIPPVVTGVVLLFTTVAKLPIAAITAAALGLTSGIVGAWNLGNEFLRRDPSDDEQESDNPNPPTIIGSSVAGGAEDGDVDGESNPDISTISA